MCTTENSLTVKSGAVELGRGQKAILPRDTLLPPHLILAHFRAIPDTRPTIHITDQSIRNSRRVAASIQYIDDLISRYILNHEYYHAYEDIMPPRDTDAYCLFNVGDEAFHFPTVVAYGCRGNHSALVPDVHFWQQKGYFKDREAFRRNWTPWSSRRQKVFWRGSTTGGSNLSLATLADLPRYRLCAAGAPGSQLHDVLDAKLTAIVQTKHPEETERIKAFLGGRGLIGMQVPQAEFLQYRFQIDIDGNQNAWGLLLKLSTGSCVLKVTSEWRQWYYDRLQPWVHFVPVKNDLSDLETQITWCLDHDREAEEIGRRGRGLANSIVFGTEMPKAAEVVIKACRDSEELSWKVRPIAKVESKMPLIGPKIAHKLYGHDIWEGFDPSPGEAEVQGWNGNHPALARLASLSINGELIIVDVGVWKGQSTITMANAMRRAQVNGCVIAVDTFLGSPEHWKGAGSLYRRVNGIPDLYRKFLSNVHAHGLTDYVVPLPQISSAASQILLREGIMVMVAHIDAAHEYEEVMRDIVSYWHLVKPGGYLIGDDYHDSWPGVVKAVGEFSARVGRPLTIEPPKWILQKPTN